MLVKQLTPFLSRLKIRDKEGAIIPFRVNACQEIILKRLQKRQEKKLPLWFILLKSRQIGGSTLMAGVLNAHCVADRNARAMIVAHQAKSSTELFQRATVMWNEIPMGRIRPEATQKQLIYPHGGQDSILSHATAGSVVGGRGLTLSALHLSEAAFFPGMDSFTSLLPAVPYNENTILCLESTANGQEGTGEAFYDFWQAAEEGRSDFEAIFVGAADDPECVRDPKEMDGVELDAEEKELVKRLKLTKAQLAWRRWCLATRCQGYLDKLHREYPYVPEEAFQASGDPVFTAEEIRVCEGMIEKPVVEGRLDAVGSGWEVRPMARSGVACLRIWETPRFGHEYYIGADAARGTEGGDFSAAVVWDGTTGEQVATFADRVSAAPFASILNKLGRYYNNARMNIELTGGYGTHVLQVLRDDFHYCNWYLWKGKNDKVSGQPRVTLCWETTWYSRERMMTAFREALRAGEVVIRDRVLLQQMKAAQRENGRFEVEMDHDDVLFAALIGWINRVDYPPVGKLRAGRYATERATKESDPNLQLPLDYFPEHRRMVQRIMDGKPAGPAVVNWEAL